ncbi:uncharacterized protein LOC122390669 isoform X2 [Amphibalanus amphitrite]|uniref:uncharacterized protein LOC122390669 isoform X2 n=1 Tax=Amphibalanus amphitrite TaxID=1232801 RepID=UPI001C92B44D|nr:uncharacterized protein LOC122390669 isoform X2 [Amphibalanus amphitrite]XP_043239768.1 uncharacterized protein LOC122390669 isoform X2 [Amphibalanus amphitrite]
MNPSRMSALGAGGDGQWVSGGPETPWQGRARPDAARRDTRRRRAREPYEASPEAQSSQRRIRRETERQRSLRTACTLMSVTSLTPACGPELLLTKYQRLSQLVRYTAFLEDATSALVRELGVRLNFDFNPVTRYIRRLRYQAQAGSGLFDFPADEADEVMKLLDTMSAGAADQRQTQGAAATSPAPSTSWGHRSAASTGTAPSQRRADEPPPAGRLPH